MQITFFDPIDSAKEPFVCASKVDEPEAGAVKTVTHDNGMVFRYRYNGYLWSRMSPSFPASVRNALIAIAARFHKGVFNGLFWWDATKKEFRRGFCALFNRHRYRLQYGNPTDRDRKRFEYRTARGLAYVFRSYGKGK